MTLKEGLYLFIQTIIIYKPSILLSTLINSYIEKLSCSQCWLLSNKYLLPLLMCFYYLAYFRKEKALGISSYKLRQVNHRCYIILNQFLTNNTRKSYSSCAFGIISEAIEMLLSLICYVKFPVLYRDYFISCKQKCQYNFNCFYYLCFVSFFILYTYCLLNLVFHLITISY